MSSQPAPPPVPEDFPDGDSFSSYLSGLGITAWEDSTKKLFFQALRAASSDANVLITGESGTGKDCLASFIHSHSRRREHPFVHVNAASIPEALFESELFGYAPGSFTGGHLSGHRGLAREASGGTLYLDEIGELSPALQTKLLQFIQEHTARSVGSAQTELLDLRIIAATNRDLEEMVAQGLFRRDLFYRLNIISFFTLPLRQRKKDLLGLITHLSQINSERFHITKKFSQDALDFLASRPWSGNLREVENFMERLYVLEDEPVITAKLLETRYSFPALKPAAKRSKPAILPLAEAAERFEGEYIRQALMELRSEDRAAEALGLEIGQLKEKMREHGICYGKDEEP